MQQQDYFYDIIASPMGDILMVCTDEGLKKIAFAELNGMLYVADYWIKDSGKLKEVSRQLKAYFGKELQQFDLPLAPEGSVFQRSGYGKRTKPYSYYYSVSSGNWKAW